MTYCVAVRNRSGLDQISTFRRRHIFEVPGERVMVLLTARRLTESQLVASGQRAQMQLSRNLWHTLHHRPITLIPAVVMHFSQLAIILAASAATGLALGQQAVLLRDLDALSPITVSRAELQRLLPRAAMSRTTVNGSVQRWTNELDGTFVISSINRARSGVSSTAPGRWHVSEDGRYCLLIEWPVSKSEESCRYIIRTTAGYYTARSVKKETEPVYPISIGG